MARAGYFAGGAALGVILYLAGFYLGGRLDARAYPDFAATYGVDCHDADWQTCEQLLGPARARALATGAEFNAPGMSRRLAVLGGAFGLSAGLAGFLWRR